MRSTFIELLHKDGRTEINKGTKICNFYLSYPNSTKQSQSECILLPIGGTERQSDCYVECVTVQHFYCTNTVQTLQSANELYLQ